MLQALVQECLFKKLRTVAPFHRTYDSLLEVAKILDALATVRHDDLAALAEVAQAIAEQRIYIGPRVIRLGRRQRRR